MNKRELYALVPIAVAEELGAAERGLKISNGCVMSKKDFSHLPNDQFEIEVHRLGGFVVREDVLELWMHKEFDNPIFEEPKAVEQEEDSVVKDSLTTESEVPTEEYETSLQVVLGPNTEEPKEREAHKIKLTESKEYHE